MPINAKSRSLMRLGVAEPVSLHVETFGTEYQSPEFIEQFVRENYDLTPKGIITNMRLLDFDYNEVSAYGHFGKPGVYCSQPGQSVNGNTRSSMGKIEFYFILLFHHIWVISFSEGGDEYGKDRDKRYELQHEDERRKEATADRSVWRLGMPLTEAVNIFFDNSLLVGGLPFEVRLPRYNKETDDAMQEA